MPRPTPGLPEIDARLEALGARDHEPSIADALEQALDYLLPADGTTTWQWACDDRYVRGRADSKKKFNPDLTPYLEDIHDGFDDPTIQDMVVVGNARSGKTTAPENYLGKMARHGPKSDVYWFMQDADAIADYTDQEFDRFIEFHEEVHKNLSPLPKHRSRNRKKVGPMFWRFAAATKSTVRGKTSPVLVGDEIDAWKRGGKQGINDPRKMMSYRRLTFGKRSKLYMCSHPDLGENAGIYMYYGQSDQRRWFWPCPHCNGFSTPYPGTDMPTTKLAYKKPEGKSVAESLEEIAASAHLECPHCGCEIDHKHKHQMNKAGKWLARGEKMDFATGEITGQRFANPMAGWTLHGTMSPFVSWGDLACDLAEARERFALTQDDKQLKEVVVKGLGECYAGPEEKRVPMDAKSVQKRLRADDDWFGLVPRFHEDGRLKVQFLTASVDTQGWGFAVGIIGWGVHGESWLVDRFDIKQINGFQNIQPHVRVDDWQVLSDFLTTQIYPFHEDETRGLKIASMAIDSQGEPGVVPNARAFNRKLVEIGMPDWKVRFIRGGRPALRDLDVANIIDRDEQNKPVEPKIFEYTIRVDDIKDIITQRLKIEQQGPGFMHIPANAPSFVYDELTNEKKVEGKYQRHGPNETFDHYVYGEWTRLKLRPEREELDFVKAPPIWAMPVPTGLGESQAPQHDTKTDLRAAVRRLV